jgi:hypothetical protein
MTRKSSSNLAFPLTPAFSLGERGKRSLSTNLFNLAGLSAAFLATSVAVSAAEPAPADKSQYHLFNPTPRELMREMSTDRPDLTESPYTVDAGHFQFETDLWNYSHDRHNSIRANTRDEVTSFATINAKAGLLNNLDLQFVIPVYNRIRSHDLSTGTISRDQGFGDLTVRMKYNLWGNDGGKTAFGVMPFVKFPTAARGLGNNSVEGGLILPLAVELPGGWGMGTMLEVDILSGYFARCRRQRTSCGLHQHHHLRPRHRGCAGRLYRVLQRLKHRIGNPMGGHGERRFDLWADRRYPTGCRSELWRHAIRA